MKNATPPASTTAWVSANIPAPAANRVQATPPPSCLPASAGCWTMAWQMSELGKADQGGGGTVAAYMAERDIDTLDAGVPVLSMHAPFETVSKLDCYMTYKCVKAVYEAK